MGTANPLPATIVDVTLASMVLILGIFFIIVGIILAGVVYRESREWRKMIMPMFDR
jgi:predicted transporter